VPSNLRGSSLTLRDNNSCWFTSLNVSTDDI
jgi:hypothetical protein